MQGISVVFIVIVMFAILIVSNAIRILREYERGVVFRLGRLIGEKGPGLILLIPMIDKMVKVSLRTVVLDIPPQDVITKDNVSIKVNAVVYFRVISAAKAIVDVENYLFATSQLSQTTLRSTSGSRSSTTSSYSAMARRGSTWRSRACWRCRRQRSPW